MPPRPGPHAHGGGDEEEEVIVVRTDGPPFVDLKARQGRGFDMDFDRVQKFLGEGKLSLSDFQRDLEAINKVYIPTAHRSYKFLRIGTLGMLGAFTVFIIMGIIGGTPEIRGVVIPICLVAFLVGLGAFVYSKWVEQPGIKQGAQLVKNLLDESVNPRYADSRYRIRWTIRVNVQKRTSLHLNQVFVERPILTIWSLRSPNDAGVLTDWPLPAALLHGIMVDDGGDEGAGKKEDDW